MKCEFLTPPEIAEQFGVKADTVRNWIKAGDLKAVNVANKGRRPAFKVSRQWLDEFVAARMVAATPKTSRRRKSSPDTKDPNFIEYY